MALKLIAELGIMELFYMDDDKLAEHFPIEKIDNKYIYVRRMAGSITTHKIPIKKVTLSYP